MATGHLNNVQIDSKVFYPKDVYEVKVLLAYFLMQINRPVTPEQLTEIATADGVVNYFAYTEAITEMLENSTVELSEKDGNRYYVLTETGKKGASDFKNIVSKSTRDRIYAAGLKLFAKLRAERDTQFEIRQGNNGWLVHCTCKDNDMTLLDITLFAPDKEQAEYIKSKILMNPSMFYGNVLNYVIENEEYEPEIPE